MGLGTMGNDKMIGSGMMNGRMSSGMMVDNPKHDGGNDNAND
jgi:hypothetical protein